MNQRVRASVPYAIAGVIALNGFLTLGTSLSRVFQFGGYLELGVGSVPGYLKVSADLQPGGFIGAVLGILLIGLGKGLGQRRRRSWLWAVLVLAAALIYSFWRGPTIQTTALSGLLLVLLALFHGDFGNRFERRPWSFAEGVAAVSVIFALAFGIAGFYLLRREFTGIETWTDAVYFAVVTYSTLGYGDVLPQSDNAKLFTICMVAIGLGTFVTALTVLIGPMIEERIKGVFSAMSKFQRTVNHVVVCGYTNVTESIVARAEDEENIEKVRQAGADEVISPSTLGGRLMAAQSLAHGEATS